MHNSWPVWIGVGTLFSLTALPASGSGRLQARILDDATGQPLAALAYNIGHGIGHALSVAEPRSPDESGFCRAGLRRRIEKKFNLR